MTCKPPHLAPTHAQKLSRSGCASMCCLDFAECKPIRLVQVQVMDVHPSPRHTQGMWACTDPTTGVPGLAHLGRGADHDLGLRSQGLANHLHPHSQSCKHVPCLQCLSYCHVHRHRLAGTCSGPHIQLLVEARFTSPR